MSRKEAVKSDNLSCCQFKYQSLGEMFLDVYTGNARQLKCKGNGSIVPGMGFSKNGFEIQIVHIHGSFWYLGSASACPGGRH